MEKETKKQKDKTNADTKPKKDKKEDNKKEDKKEDKNEKEVVVNETNNNSNINSKNKKEKIELDSNTNIKQVDNEKIKNPSKDELIFAIASYSDVKRIKSKKDANVNIRPRIMELFSASKSNKSKLSFIENIMNKEKIHISEDFYGLLLKLYYSKMKKQRRICMELIDIFLNYCNKRIVVENTQNSGRIYYNKIKEKFREMTFLINKVALSMHVGLENTIGFIERVFEDLNYDISEKNLSLSDVKTTINNKLTDFQSDRLDKIQDIIIKNGINLIKPKDRILIFGLNSNLKEIFRKASENGIQFEIVYIFNKANEVDNDSKDKDLEFLSSLNISVTYSLIVNCSSIFSQITKVFLRAKAILSNGSFIGEIGNSLIANIAHYFNIPVIVFCELFKFWDKIMLNDIKESNIIFGKKENKGRHLNTLNFNYDMTDSKLISMIVTEIGYIPPFSIKAVIREYVSEK